MPEFVRRPTLATIKLELLAGFDAPFAAWQSVMNGKAIQSEGFISLEFFEIDEKRHAWSIVQRFDSAEALNRWLQSDAYLALRKELKSFAIQGSFTEGLSEEEAFKRGVTQVIIAEIDPLHEKTYQEWSAKIHRAEAEFEGFLGVYIQSPKEVHGRFWITLLQFDTPKNLDRWLNSPERNALLQEAAPLITTLESHRIVSPFAGWFATLAKTATLPSPLKQAMVVLLVLFPIVMLEMRFLNPWLASMHPSPATFIGNALSVALLTFPLMPIALWALNSWLTPSQQQKRGDAWGYLLMAFLYALEVVFFWVIF